MALNINFAKGKGFNCPLPAPAFAPIGSVGVAGQIAAGHVLAAASFPSAAVGANLSWWNLSADGADASGNGKTLTPAASPVYTDNLSTFAVTSFILDKDLVKCYWAESGLCLIYPGFQISGNSLVFPTNTFYDVTDVDVTLVVQQLEGASFDNSDTNGALLTENHLGSTSAGLDRSVAGRGIYLRNANGVLREVALDIDDNLVVLDT
jgi:hypothetical protein